MHSELFFKIVRSYYDISPEAEESWSKLLVYKKYAKGEYFISAGQHPTSVAFVVTGLFSQNYLEDNGDVVIKYFFPERRVAASLVATLTGKPSPFYIEAIEDSTVLQYDFLEFKKLFEQFPDIAMFYINYNERHWIIEKEPFEITLRTETAAERYDNFLKKYPNLVHRLKKHHIASYLGITPTQLSRIFLTNK